MNMKANLFLPHLHNSDANDQMLTAQLRVFIAIVVFDTEHTC